MEILVAKYLAYMLQRQCGEAWIADSALLTKPMYASKKREQSARVAGDAVSAYTMLYTAGQYMPARHV